ncbi:hypothetical protein BKA70DRAFT_1218364 [Coprinopsis sp. MPI-PUGE-AT-0042]|nr:hypothetical protein BKA70DRAFT_1219110 [Coprinopsis sp. MPI-PUGE-AT-0042]KAH6913412.1 hypothetical protein BKA70DRAFT_1218364 [Coprinopsis sp. MPI-PUGE-AT-0042]
MSTQPSEVVSSDEREQTFADFNMSDDDSETGSDHEEQGSASNGTGKSSAGVGATTKGKEAVKVKKEAVESRKRIFETMSLDLEQDGLEEISVPAKKKGEAAAGSSSHLAADSPPGPSEKPHVVYNDTYVSDQHFLYFLDTMGVLREEVRLRQNGLYRLRDLLVRDGNAIDRAIWAEEEALRAQSESEPDSPKSLLLLAIVRVLDCLICLICWHDELSRSDRATYKELATRELGLLLSRHTNAAESIQWHAAMLSHLTELMGRRTWDKRSVRIAIQPGVPDNEMTPNTSPLPVHQRQFVWWREPETYDGLTTLELVYSGLIHWQSED